MGQRERRLKENVHPGENGENIHKAGIPCNYSVILKKVIYLLTSLRGFVHEKCGVCSFLFCETLLVFFGRVGAVEEGSASLGKCHVSSKKTIPLDRNVWTRRKSNIQPWDWEALREVEESLRPRHWWKRKLKTQLAKKKDARGDSQRQK